MGDHPTLSYTLDESRVVDTRTGGTISDRPATLPSHVLLQWAVAVVTCPYCGQAHEHPMSRVAGWGWYRAPCDTDRCYYLIVNADA